uniref:Uncharacterized protein n=1 Tax=Rhizophora mucronata TaxID=61149 RepID=A0A2P2NPR2_RHIMU
MQNQEKANLGLHFHCDGPGKGEHVKYLLGIMYYSHFHCKRLLSNYLIQQYLYLYSEN